MLAVKMTFMFLPFAHRARPKNCAFQSRIGDEELYVSGYSDAALQGWERKIRAWARGDTPVDAQADGATPLKTSKPPRHLRLL